MKLRLSILITVLLLIWPLVHLYSQSSTARFMLWHPSARAVAMGGTSTALDDNAFAVFYNPAALPSDKYSFVGSYVEPFPFLESTIHSLTAFSMPINGFGILGISANRFWKESQAFTNEVGDIMGGDLEKPDFLKATHWEIKLTYATALSKNISFGINLSYLRIKLSEATVGQEKGEGKTSTLLYGGGILFKNILNGATLKLNNEPENDFLRKYADNREFSGFSIGMSILNAGSKIKYVDYDQGDKPPTIFSIGFAYWPISSSSIDILISTDFEKEVHESSTLDYIHYGGEIRLINLLALRAGYFSDVSDPKTSYYTCGAGILLKFLSLNVARYERAYLPTWHFDATLALEI